MNKQVEQIRAKIERKIKMMERNIASLGDGGASISIATYQDVLNIIDSMADEQPNEDLETEIATWIPAHLKGNVDEDIIDAVKRWGENVARHFAQWQKEQMLKDAVEYKVCNNLANYPIIYYEVSSLGLKYGDKVKIIIVKEDEK